MGKSQKWLHVPPDQLADFRYLTVKQAAIYLNVSVSWLNKVRVGLCSGESPPWIRLNTRVLYSRETLDSWMKEREHAR